MARRKTKRELTPPERELWQKIASSVTPIDPVRPVESPAIALDDQRADAPGFAARPAKAPPRPSDHRNAAWFKKTSAQVSVDPTPHKRTGKSAGKSSGKGAPEIGPAEPGHVKRVAKGKLPIDGTLDLHGLRQDEAYARLKRFVDFGRMRGARTLLVITGKGSPDGPDSHDPFGAPPRGILRRRFLEWVEQMPLAANVSSVSRAHQRHGGGGAFYVFLRRNSR